MSQVESANPLRISIPQSNQSDTLVSKFESSQRNEITIHSGVKTVRSKIDAGSIERTRSIKEAQVKHYI
jgi:hypothetical protein